MHTRRAVKIYFIKSYSYKLENPLDQNGRENDASAGLPDLTSASFDLDL